MKDKPQRIDERARAMLRALAQGNFIDNDELANLIRDLLHAIRQRKDTHQ